MSEPCTGIEFDLAIPAPSRDQKSWNALATKPHDATNAANARFAQPRIGGRR